ncbi:MAG: transposase [Bryobacteraceae bacterium]
MMLIFMLFSEVGRDMSRWPTAAHFVSWLGLCPDNDISGGRCCGEACAAPRTERVPCSDWLPTRYTVIHLPWVTTCAA